MDGGGKGLFSNTLNKKYYRTIADPIFTDDAVYLVMFGTRDRTKYIEKHDLESGCKSSAKSGLI
jgi:hypothetical protein